MGIFFSRAFPGSFSCSRSDASRAAAERLCGSGLKKIPVVAVWRMRPFSGTLRNVSRMNYCRRGLLAIQDHGFENRTPTQTARRRYPKNDSPKTVPKAIIQSFYLGSWDIVFGITISAIAFGCSPLGARFWVFAAHGGVTRLAELRKCMLMLWQFFPPFPSPHRSCCST